MPILLSRIDDRLIHGQVVIGWGRSLDIERIVLVDDVVATNDWEQELYCMGVPEGMAVEFRSVGEATALLRDWAAGAERVAILTGDVHSMVQLAGAAPDLVASVNLGGIHHRAGRVQRAAYVYLSAEEFEELAALMSSGVSVTAQDVPTTAPIPLDALS